MRLLIDTDVLLEFVAKRQAAAAEWDKLNALELTGCAELWACSSSFASLRQALLETLSDEDIRSALRSTMGFLSVCSVDGADVRFALDHVGSPYDAAIAESCARKIQADFIITRRGALDIPRAARCVTPGELFEVLERERGIVFDIVDF